MFFTEHNAKPTRMWTCVRHLVAASRSRSTMAAAALLAVASFSPVTTLQAQDGVTAPVAREQELPEAPTNRFGMPMVGWVKVRYTVLADGTTTDVRAIERLPQQLSTREAERAVQEWRFDPAMVAGEAIDWLNNESTIVYDVEGVPLAPRPVFAQEYMNVVESLNAEDFDEARRGNERLAATAARLAEIGLAETQSAIVSLGLEDMHAAYKAILHATDPDVVTLGPDELAGALNYRYAIEIELGRVTDALETFRRLSAVGSTEPRAELVEQVATIEQALAGDAALAISGYVDREPWVHVPSRRTFTFGEVDGDVREIEVECDRRETVLEFMPDVDWTLPASWGSCTMFVHARRDTTFLLYEFK